MQTDMIELMSSQQGSPAKTSALAKEMPKASTVPALAFGQKSPELLAEYDHAGSSENVPALLDRGCVLSETWLQSGMTRSGKLYQLPQSEHSPALASGLLPTISYGIQGVPSTGSEAARLFVCSKMSAGLRTSPERSTLYDLKLCRGSNGVSQRLHAIGNSIVPQLAAVILSAIKEVEHGQDAA